LRGSLLRDAADPPGLRALAYPARLLVSLFLLGAAAGLLAGEGNVLATHAGNDGRPELSMEDLRRAYHGRPGWTLIGSKVDGGSMEKHVPVPSERAAIVEWARAGARREEFDPVRRVLDRRCVKCHAPGGEKEGSPFAASREAGAEWGLVSEYARPDRGMSAAKRATTTHAHLFGMTVLFGLLGAVFLFTGTRRGVKAIVVAAPFAGMALDIGSWWLALLSPAFCWGIVAGGALLASSLVVLVARPLWEMWGPEPKGP
jgi:hypothetical protein